jgi:predicted RNase H-like nuclease
MDTRELPRFIGLDLAWSDRNPSGGAIIAGGNLVAWTGGLTDDDSILEFVRSHSPAGAPAVIGVDAPLRVTNLTGRRRCDREASLAWGRFDAGAYPANRTLLARNGVVRGEALVNRLSTELGFVEYAPIPKQLRTRLVCEVFPHPAHVAIFGLPTILRYKRKLGRSRSLIDSELMRYQALLRSLQAHDPPLRGVEAACAADIPALKGRSLKALEDTLDAITCAYVVNYLWHHGPDAALVYGSVKEGHILTPAPSAR